MKKLLLSTALVAVSGAAFADNYKVQLDNLDNAFQCQNHFERGGEIAGTIDKFEFCVWYLNSNRKGFIRNDMFYDILPTGDVIAVKKNLLSSNSKAKAAIKAAINVIIEEKTVEVELPNGDIVKVSKDTLMTALDAIEYASTTISSLNDEVDSLTAELTKVATDAEMEIAAKTAKITRISEELATTTAMITTLSEANAILEAVNGDLEAGAVVSAEKIKMLEETLAAEKAASIKAATKAANEIAELNIELGLKQGEINGLHTIITGLESSNADLDAKFQEAAARRDELKTELEETINAYSAYADMFNNVALQQAYEDGKAKGEEIVQAAFDEYKAEAVAEITEATATIAQNMVDLTNLSNMVETLNETITTKNGELHTANATITTLNTTIGNLEADITAEQKKVSDLEAKVVRLDSEIVTHQGSITELKIERDGLVTDLATANETIKTLTEDLAAEVLLKEHWEGIVSEQAIEIGKLTNQVSTLNIDLGRLNDQIGTLSAEKQELFDAINAVDGYVDQVNDLTSELTEVKAIRDNLNTAIYGEEGYLAVIEDLNQDVANEKAKTIIAEQSAGVRSNQALHTEFGNIATALGLTEVAEMASEEGTTTERVFDYDENGVFRGMNIEVPNMNSFKHAKEVRDALVQAVKDKITDLETQLANVDTTHELNIQGRFGIMGNNIHDFGDLIVAENGWHSINVQPVVEAYIDSLDLDAKAQEAFDSVSSDVYTQKLSSWTLVEASGAHQVLGGNDYVRVTLGTKDTSPDTWVNITRLETYLANNNWDNVVSEITTAAKRAYEEGYNDGYEDGYEDGYKDGFKDGVSSLKS